MVELIKAQPNLKIWIMDFLSSLLSVVEILISAVVKSLIHPCSPTLVEAYQEALRFGYSCIVECRVVRPHLRPEAMSQHALGA